ncbi:MAG: hypothetical protein ACFFFC_18815 [Candidatus Thorarchaeota archaeon]
MRRKRRFLLVILLAFVFISFNIKPVAASTITTPKHTQLITGLGTVAKMGASTEFFLSYGDDLHPQYYSAAIASGSSGQGLLFYVEELRIDVEGWDPLGNKLLPDRFTSLSVLVSPQSNQAIQTVLSIIYYAIVDLLPVGLKQSLQRTTIEGGGQTGYSSDFAWAKWERPTFATPEMERGIRFGYQLAVDPDLEGTYTIHILTAMWICAYDGIHTYHTGTRVLQLTLYYGYDANPSGGGCPILSVFNGSEYADEGLIDIHSDFDLEKAILIHSSPVPIGNAYRMRLTEHPQTISHIDEAQLYGRLSNGIVLKLPLKSALHSSLGDVTNILRHSDDIRVDTLGAIHNNGTSEYIDLEFTKLGNLEFVEYIFQIEGYNYYTKH